jgi:hypothetical protein
MTTRHAISNTPLSLSLYREGTGVEYSAMGDAARHLLQSFEALSETERREVLEELLRRAAELPYSFPSDEELVRAADQVFQDLDRREAKG